MSYIYESFAFFKVFVFSIFLYLKQLMHWQCHTNKEIQLDCNRKIIPIYFSLLLPFFLEQKRRINGLFKSVMLFFYYLHSFMRQLQSKNNYMKNCEFTFLFNCQYKRAFWPRINSIKSTKYNLSSLSFPQCLKDL